MRIVIDIPSEFDEVFEKNGFVDFFQCVLSDIGLPSSSCGRDERELAAVLLDAFRAAWNKSNSE